jgi:hypothetical protein
LATRSVSIVYLSLFPYLRVFKICSSGQSSDYQNRQQQSLLGLVFSCFQ